MEKAERDLILRQGVVLPETPRDRRERAALEEDLRAMELPLPSEVELIEEADGTMVLKRKQPAAAPAAKPAAANAFVCDTPDGE